MQESSGLAISSVTYAPSLPVVQQTLSSLNRALGYVRHGGALGRTRLCLVDKGPGEVWEEKLHDLASKEWQPHPGFVELLGKHGNLGYGAGHNLAIHRWNCDFYLVLNPNVVLEEDVLFQALTFMTSHPGRKSCRNNLSQAKCSNDSFSRTGSLCGSGRAYTTVL